MRHIRPFALLLLGAGALAAAGRAHAGPDRTQAAPAFRIAMQAQAGGEPLAAALRKAGFTVMAVPPGELSDPACFNRDRYDALLLPMAVIAPFQARDNLLAFVRRGGDLIVVGGPLFELSRSMVRTEWYRMKLMAMDVKPLVQWDKEDMARWQRGSSNMASTTTYTVEHDLPGGRADLRMAISDLTGWDTIARPLTMPNASDRTVLRFLSKGDAKTGTIAVEIQEKDGSRWISPVAIAPQWNFDSLTEDDFGYWPDNAAKGRGGPGDHLHFANAARISLGVAQSHGSVPNGPHTVWISDIQAGTLPPGAHKPDLTLPTLETLSPEYKTYHLPSLHPTPAERTRDAATGNQSGTIVVPVPRPRGLGFGDERAGRWIPLYDAPETELDSRHDRVSMYLNLSGPYRGAVFGQEAGASTPTQLAGDVVMLAGRMADGVFIEQAGAGGFSYWTGEPWPVGAAVVNVSRQPRAVRLALWVGHNDGKDRLQTWERAVTLAPGARQELRETWNPGDAPPGDYEVTATVWGGERMVDSVQQVVSLLAPPHAPRDAFITVRDGDFYAPGPDGRPRKWYPYGVNYWQSNVAGTDPTQYADHWLSLGFYDPDIVESDLALLQKLGFTTVSIQLTRPDQLRQVNDFLPRAASHGLRVNLYVSGAHPFETNLPLLTRLLKEGRFAGNPAIWAYDLAWEHHLGNHEERAKWDADWERWVVNRYGSIAHAEQAWGYRIPRDRAGRVTNPPDEQLRTDGPWLKMAAAYERCADDVISRRYARIIRHIRRLDPKHLVSARSASQPSWTSWFAFDLVSTGKAFDFASPEGYGLVPEEAGFTVAYGRWAGNGKPVYWSEFGASIWPYDHTGEKEAHQAELHRGFAQMLLSSGANGLASWWNVGGFRVDEKSDFGIIAPDGTPRASARELEKYAAQATAPRAPKPPTEWVTIDRDRHAAAYQAVYDENKKRYVDVLKAGGMLGVRTAGTGTTSADCPLTCVGDLPWDGFGPLKFLNAELNSVEIRNARGAWEPVEDGQVVEVAVGKPIEARLSVGNNGEARWLASGLGGVRVVGDDRPDANSLDAPRLTFAAPLPRPVARYEDVKVPAFVLSPGITRESEAVFTLEAAGRARFGERLRVVLRPVG